jgi:thiamine pyrophosphokinase
MLGSSLARLILLALLGIIILPNLAKSLLFKPQHSFTTARNNQLTSMSSSTTTSNNGNTLHFTSPLLLDQNKNGKSKPPRTALIILNSPIARPPSPLFEELWKRSDIRICADGGANRLYDATLLQKNSQELSSSSSSSQDYIPDRIKGDLDSLLPHVRDYYDQFSTCRIEKDPSQDTNDLDKSLQILMMTQDDDGNTSTTTTSTTSTSVVVVDRVIVYGAFGGRFDQEMASFQALYKWGPKFGYQIFLYSDETCAFLLPPQARCEIRMPYYNQNHNHDQDHHDPNRMMMMGEGPTCGLIPLSCKCDSITTSGLQWNLDGTMPLEFGGLVSSSNRIMEPVVTVEASHPVIFTAEIIHPRAPNNNKT